MNFIKKFFKNLKENENAKIKEIRRCHGMSSRMADKGTVNSTLFLAHAIGIILILFIFYPR
jgi:hypothetical protein